jgi:hypothetical protein
MASLIWINHGEQQVFSHMQWCSNTSAQAHARCMSAASQTNQEIPSAPGIASVRIRSVQTARCKIGVCHGLQFP